MKGIRILVLTLIFSIASSIAWSAINKRAIIINFKELEVAGIHNLEKIQSDLLLKSGTEKLVVRHVITTGQETANSESILLDLDALEQINPPLKAYAIMKENKQIALTNAQVNSLIRLLKINSLPVPRWLANKKQNKYINMVLQKTNSKDNRGSALTVLDANMLLTWAIKKHYLVKADHPL